jgi:hypothetical protein
MIEEICSGEEDDIQLFADEIVNLLHSLDDGKFYAYINQAVCEFTQEFKITEYFANLKKPNDYPVSVCLTYPPVSMPPDELKSSDDLTN